MVASRSSSNDRIEALEKRVRRNSSEAEDQNLSRHQRLAHGCELGFSVRGDLHSDRRAERQHVLLFRPGISLSDAFSGSQYAGLSDADRREEVSREEHYAPQL